MYSQTIEPKGHVGQCLESPIIHLGVKNSNLKWTHTALSVQCRPDGYSCWSPLDIGIQLMCFCHIIFVYETKVTRNHMYTSQTVWLSPVINCLWLKWNSWNFCTWYLLSISYHKWIPHHVQKALAANLIKFYF